MDCIIALLKEWKELVGAVIGGVFSLFVALLVARQARRAEERASAMLLIGDLTRVMVMADHVGQGAENKNVTEEEQKTGIAEQLCQYRVRLSSLFEASMSRVMNCDTYLASNLTVTSAFIRDTEPLLERLEKDLEHIHRSEEASRPRELIYNDIKVVVGTYKKIGEYSKFTVLLLEQQVLGGIPAWHRVRRRIYKNEWERDYFALLQRERE